MEEIKIPIKIVIDDIEFNAKIIKLKEKQDDNKQQD